MTNGLSELARRVAQLDAEPSNPRVIGGSCVAISHFIRVLGQTTSTGTPRDVRALPCVSPVDADGLLGSSRLLTQLADVVPEIVTGPLRFDSQYWVGTGKPSFVPSGELTPKESAFICVSDATTMDPSTKPFGGGLFTSTGVLGTYGMWRIYLELNRGSTLHPLPWYTWAVEPHRHAIVHEITTAAEWVGFVLSHPRREHELLFPNWESVARNYDAVHMTLRAIGATQGLYFPTEQGIVAAPYWDIESTMWLRWCFGSVRLVETVT
jgi:hypothetical protein